MSVFRLKATFIYYKPVRSFDIEEYQPIIKDNPGVFATCTFGLRREWQKIADFDENIRGRKFKYNNTECIALRAYSPWYCWGGRHLLLFAFSDPKDGAIKTKTNITRPTERECVDYFNRRRDFLLGQSTGMLDWLDADYVKRIPPLLATHSITLV
jgi:hypothetical protein